MEVGQLTKLINENIDKITSIDGYKAILNRQNDLIRFNVLNRILIFIQNNKAVDLKTDEEWLMLNRKVTLNQKPIYILMPKYSYKYVDTETGLDIDDIDLNSDEIIKALEYGLISKVESIDNMYTLHIYDVRQTTGTGDSIYVVNRPLISSRIILELLNSVTGCTLELCDDTYYSKSENKIYISKKPYKELAYTISKIIANYLVNNKLKDIMKYTDVSDDNQLSEYDIELLEISLSYAICTLLHGSGDFDFDYIMHTNTEKLIYILNLVDVLILDVVHKLEFRSDTNIDDAISNITKIRKAEAILDILEANNINKLMKGM